MRGKLKKHPPNNESCLYSPRKNLKEMRALLNRRTSTKSERRFAELLKKHHIPFIHRALIEGREVDFIVGKYAIEINGHAQDTQRNTWLIKRGLVPLHVSNHVLRDIPSEVEEHVITKLKTYATTR